MATNNNHILKAINLVNEGKSYPALDLVSKNPELASVVSKLVSPLQRPQQGKNGTRDIPSPNTSELRSIVNNKARAINDAQTVMQLLPDMELAAQILISSILSPKDMMAGELIFTAPEGVVNAQTSSSLLTALRTHFDQVYKIKQELGKILRNVLFERGSHVMVVLPENSLDEVINRNFNITMEDISGLADKNGKLYSLGILGPREKNANASTNNAFGGIALENFQEYSFGKNHSTNVILGDASDSNRQITLENVIVTDNVDTLKFPLVAEKIRTQRISQALGRFNGVQAALESSKIAYERNPKKESIPGFTDMQLTQLLYKGRSHGYTPIVSVKNDALLSRKAVGMPLIMQFPSESVIPVHMPGHNEHHVGYFVMLDANGNPVSKESNKDYYAELSERMGTNSSGSYTSQLVQRIKNSMQGFDCGNRDHIDYSARVYAEMVEQDLIARLRNGVYSNGAALANNQEIYRIMLARTLAGQQTQLLFIPVELVTYFAFKYNDDGTGKSLLEDMKMLNSLRAITMFSNVMASIRNSIGRTDVHLKLDEDDPDPRKSIEILQNEFVRSRQQAFPLGANSPVDMVNYLQRASVEFSYEGHPGLPDVKLDIAEKGSSNIKPDQELEDSLRKRGLQGLGINPEMVDASNGAEFATSIANNNILLSRRVMQIQDQFTPLLMDHLRKVINATPSLIEILRSIIEENFESNQDRLTDEQKKAFEGPGAKDYAINQLLYDFINGLEVQLPRPNTVTLENQSQALETYIKLLDAVLDAWISDRFFTTEVAGEVASNAAVVREVVRSYYIRTWMAENGVMPELSAITAADDDGKPQVDFWAAQESHIEGLTRSLTKFMVNIQKPKSESDTKLHENGVEEGAGSSGGFGGGSTDFSNTGSDYGLDDSLPPLEDDAGMTSPAEGTTDQIQQDSSNNQSTDNSGELDDDPEKTPLL